MSVQFLLVQIRPLVYIYNYVRFLVGKAISNTLHLTIYKFEIIKFYTLIFPKIESSKFDTNFKKMVTLN